jgi:hypothetical protein
VTSEVAELTYMKKQVSTNDKKKLKGEVQPKRNRDIKVFQMSGIGTLCIIVCKSSNYDSKG